MDESPDALLVRRGFHAEFIDSFETACSAAP